MEGKGGEVGGNEGKVGGSGKRKWENGRKMRGSGGGGKGINEGKGGRGKGKNQICGVRSALRSPGAIKTGEEVGFCAHLMPNWSSQHPTSAPRIAMLPQPKGFGGKNGHRRVSLVGLVGFFFCILGSKIQWERNPEASVQCFALN